jgi:hypothetical protein
MSWILVVSIILLVPVFKLGVASAMVKVLSMAFAATLTALGFLSVLLLLRRKGD